MKILPKLTYNFKAILIKIPADFFAETNKRALKVAWKEVQGPKISQTILIKKKKWRTHTLVFQNLLES